VWDRRRRRRTVPSEEVGRKQPSARQLISAAGAWSTTRNYLPASAQWYLPAKRFRFRSHGVSKQKREQTPRKSLFAEFGSARNVKEKVRFIYMASRLPHMPPQRRCRHRQGRRTAWAAAHSRAHGLWPVAIQPHEALVCRLMVSSTTT